MSRFAYSFDILTNRKTFRDLVSSSPLRKLLGTIKSELGQRLNDISSEELGTGDGSNKAFSGTLSSPSVNPESLSVQAVVVGDTTETFTDDGEGNLTSDGGGSGYIDYVYGTYSLTFNTAPKNSELVSASYQSYAELVSYGLNHVYDSRFIQHATGEDLDNWGETLDLERNTGESDEDYRTRLLNELRDFAENLTEKGICSRVNAIIGSDPSIIEHHSLAPDWPLDWSDTTNNWTTWVPWEELVDFLLVVPTGLTDIQISQIAEAVIDVKFACARCLVVTDSGSGYYELVKLVE